MMGGVPVVSRTRGREVFHNELCKRSFTINGLSESGGTSSCCRYNKGNPIQCDFVMDLRRGKTVSGILRIFLYQCPKSTRT